MTDAHTYVGRPRKLFMHPEHMISYVYGTQKYGGRPTGSLWSQLRAGSALLTGTCVLLP